MRIYGFAPIIPEEPRVLILGSMPSAVSLEKQEYYGHPRNHFWPILFELFQKPLSHDYEKKRELLYAYHIAVWDIYSSCYRPGSMDKDIKEGQFNDIAGLAAENPSIQVVFCNGTAAERGLRSFNASVKEPEKSLLASIPVYRMPSTSPIPTKFYRRMEDKINSWAQILDFI